MRRVMVFALLSALVAATAVFAEPPSNVGKPNPGKPRPAEDLYGDLYIIERDPDTGEPWVDSEGCVRPLFEDCSFIPLLHETASRSEDEDDPCDIDPLYVDFLQPIELGRMSVARAPQFVMDQAYVEAIKRFNSAHTLALDPAGRINYCLDPCEASDWFTIDSPLENLAMYQQLMKMGWLEDIVRDEDGEGWIRAGVPLAMDLTPFGLEYLNDDALTTEDFDQAASFMGAAADKTSFVGRGAIVVINTLTGVNLVSEDDTSGQTTIEYFSYEDYLYEQDKCYPAHTDTTLLRPFPPEWTCPDTEDPMQCFFSDVVDISEETYLFRQLEFCEGGVSVPYDPMATGGLHQFTQGVEHARSVINFLHNWSVPVF